MATFDLDFTGDTPEVVDSGGRPPVGDYLCDLIDVSEDSRNEDQTIFEYQIVEAQVAGKDAPGFVGKKIFDRVRQPSSIESEEGRKMETNKIKIRAHRLGLWDGQAVMKLVDFTTAIGARVVISLGSRIAKEGQYKGQEFVEPKFDGVYNLTHAKCPARWKQASTTATPGAVAASEVAAASIRGPSSAQAQQPANGAPSIPPAAPAAPPPAANLWSDL